MSDFKSFYKYIESLRTCSGMFELLTDDKIVIIMEEPVCGCGWGRVFNEYGFIDI